MDFSDFFLRKLIEIRLRFINMFNKNLQTSYVEYTGCSIEKISSLCPILYSEFFLIRHCFYVEIPILSMRFLFYTGTVFHKLALNIYVCEFKCFTKKLYKVAKTECRYLSSIVGSLNQSRTPCISYG